LLEDLFQQLIALPTAAVYVVIGGLAAVENVFPPVPADSVVALGAFLSQFGPLSAGTVFIVTWLANIAGAVAVYAVARTLGRSFFTSPVGRRLLRPAALERLEGLYARHGTWGIFLSRFIPGVRAVVPPFAGVAKLSAARTLIPAAVASGIWYGAITVTVVFVAEHLSDVARLVTGVNRVAFILGFGVVVFVTVFVIVQRQRRIEELEELTAEDQSPPAESGSGSVAGGRSRHAPTGASDDRTSAKQTKLVN
jgi:membrane protein DedA with SNARE-associated domain